MKAVILIVLTGWSLVSGDFDCLCNYNVEQPVYPTADVNGQPLGFMYEFDCKPLANAQGNGNKMYTVQFEKKVGYVTADQQVQVQTCPGDPIDSDLIPSPVPTTEQTTKYSSAMTSSTTLQTTPTRETTTTSTTTRSTTPQPITTQTTTPKLTTTQTTSQSTTPQPTTQSTTPQPTTQSTTPQPTTTQSTTPQPTTTQSTTQQPATTPTTTQSPTTTKPTFATKTSTVRPTTQSTTPTTQPTTFSSTIMATTVFMTKMTTPFMYWSMAANVSGTPYQYVGVGYNLLKGNPATISDPGFLTSQRIFQLTGTPSSVREAVYEKHAACNRQTDTILLYSSQAYQDELKRLVQPSASHNSHLMDSAFTYSSQFQSMRQSLDSGYNVYFDKITTCSYGSVRMATENFTVSREFAKDVCSLPESMTALSNVKYMQFLDKWGTSIVTRAHLGTKSVDRYKGTPPQLYQHVAQTDSGLLKYTGAYKSFPSSITINTHDYPHSKAAASTFGSRHTTSTGTAYHQIPVGAELVPISYALNWAYWTPVIDELVAEGICSDSIYTSNLTQYLQGITMALKEYPAYKSGNQQHPLVDRPAIQVPITWPSGTYGLMKSTGGCPGSNTRWQEGYRKFDTEDTFSSHNSFTTGIQNYLSGEFHSNDILNRFCMKTNTHSISDSQYDQQWPKGSYCLLKKGSCPSGFGSGYIHWDDEDITNHNAKGGILPDGTYDKNTQIYYCCRNDGSPATKLILPTDRPFVMMRYGSTCQAVHGMNLHELYVRWDDENTFNKDKTGGMHPLDDGGSRDHKIHFCHYQSAAGPAIVG